MFPSALPAPPVERRTQPRARPADYEVICYLGWDVWRARCHDLCAQGLGVLLERALDPDTRLTVELFNRPGNFWHRKRLRVVHATPGGSLWTVGGVFIQEFSAEELNSLLA